MFRRQSIEIDDGFFQTAYNTEIAGEMDKPFLVTLHYEYDEHDKETIITIFTDDGHGNGDTVMTVRMAGRMEP